MRAYVTSIDEPTTDLCVWSLKRNGFEVYVLNDIRTLARKLSSIYSSVDDDFLRVDADVIPNRNCTPQNVSDNPDKYWWVQFMTFDWFQQRPGYGGIQFIRKEAINILRNNIQDYIEEDRPETAMFRLEEFMKPRRCVSNSEIMGLHNYKNDLKRVARVKANRGQSSNYDFELAQRLNEL